MSQLNTIPNLFAFLDCEVTTAIDNHSAPWFCAKDVCKSLDITWNGSTLQNMPEEWQGMLKLSTPGGEQDAIFISESGLFHLVSRSNKPKAREFSNWVCGTVLPEIRATGFFGTLNISDHIKVAKQIDQLTLSLVETKNPFRRKLLMDQLQKLCNIAKQPMPPTEWIAQSLDQVDIFALENTNG